MADAVFKYDGRVYVRPVGRGVVMLDSIRERELYVEDCVPDGYYRLRLTFESLPEDEARAAREEMARV